MSIVPADEIALDTIRAAQFGDKRAREMIARTLLNASTPRIRAEGSYLNDHDEAQSLAGCAILRSVNEYDGTGTLHGHFLNAYNSLVCNSKRRGLRIQRTEREYIFAAADYFEKCEPNDRESSHDISRMRAAATTLPPRQRAVYAALAAGRNAADIARDLKISRQSAYRLTQRVIENLGRALGARAAA